MPRSQTRNLHDLTRQNPTAEELQSLFDEVYRASDRSAAIIFTNAVDSALRSWILFNLPVTSAVVIESLYGKDGVLSNIYSANILAQAMGILPTVICDDVNQIRKIRNAFAHAAVPIEFTLPEISKEVKKFSLWNAIEREYDFLRKHHKLPRRKKPSLERVAFTTACNEALIFILQKHSKAIDKDASEYSEFVEDFIKKIATWPEKFE